MFGYDPCWWYGLTVFFIFIGLNLIVWALRNKPRTSYAIAWIIAAYLLIVKFKSYIYNQAIGDHLEFPVEFSALSYIVYGILVIFGGKRASHYGAFCAVLAGMVYSAASWLAPSNFAWEQGMRYLLMPAVFNHHVMYLGGMLLIANCRHYSVKKTWWHMLLGVGSFVGYSWIIHLFTPYSAVKGKPLIIRICDGEILQKIMPADKITPAITTVYIIFAISVVLLLIVGFYVLNHLTSRRRMRKGLPVDYYASNWDILLNVLDDWRKPKEAATPSDGTSSASEDVQE